MKNSLLVIIVALCIYSCGIIKNSNRSSRIANAKNDTIRIANDSLEYEIIIIEPGFNLFMNTIAKPEGYYSQSWLENKNSFLVTDYNQRVHQPNRYNPSLYVQEINYNPDIDYGYEVNYLLYYYFVYLSRQYNQQFSVSTRI